MSVKHLLESRGFSVEYEGRRNGELARLRFRVTGESENRLVIGTADSALNIIEVKLFS
jgi:hypothetical protein